MSLNFQKFPLMTRQFKRVYLKIPPEFYVTFTDLHISWNYDHRDVRGGESFRLFCRLRTHKRGEVLLMQSQWLAVGHAEVDASRGGQKLTYKRYLIDAKKCE